jgi:hypothetical protein
MALLSDVYEGIKKLLSRSKNGDKTLTNKQSHPNEINSLLE